jgi:hypothetical protein
MRGGGRGRCTGAGMSEIVMVKKLGALRPCDEQGEEALRLVRDGEVKVKITQPRNIRFHRLFFSLLKLVAENNPNFHSTDDVLDYLKMKLRLFTVVQFPDGSTHTRLGSISFAKMDETEFHAFAKRCIDVLSDYWLPGVTSEDVHREFLERIG